MKWHLAFFAACISLLLLSGCSSLSSWMAGKSIASGNESKLSAVSTNKSANGTSADAGKANGTNATGGSPALPAAQNYVKYANAYSFRNFTDPNEGAFSLDVPGTWAVTPGSGLVRPYIDAGVAFEAKSPQGQAFFFQDPYDYVYVTPNQVLDSAGFKEGSLYGGVSKPMMVRKYALASDLAPELIAKSGVQATNVKTADRPELLQNNPMLAQQSASETTFDYTQGGKKMSAVLVVKTGLVQISGTGVWSVSVMEYYSPAELVNETGLIALDMQRSFKIDPAWAKRENAALQKRLGIIAGGQSDVSATIKSVFETRSKSMDELNQKWDNAILGIEDVYEPETGSHYVVESGSNFYWADPQGNIYGTKTDESPLPGEDLKPLTCPGC